MGFKLKFQEILPKMRAVLVDWIVRKYTGCERQILEHFIARSGSTSSSTCCRRRSSALSPFWTGFERSTTLVTSFDSLVGFGLLLLPGICRKRSPASVGRNFSWWGSPVCSLQPSMQDQLKIRKIFCKKSKLWI